MTATMQELIGGGRLASLGLLSPAAVSRAAELLDEVERTGIETIRIVFADPHGILRGKTITARALKNAFCAGIKVPSTLLLKDVSHRTVFPVWSADGDTPMHGAGDILLAPLPDSFVQVPFSPHSAMIHCDIVRTDGTAIAFASRTLLQNAIDRLADHGMRAIFGLEVEFSVFKAADPAQDQNDTATAGCPPQMRPINQGYQYLTETRYGQSEEVLDSIRRMAEAMGMPVQSVEIEIGPGQFEFTFSAADPMTIADMAVTFRAMVKELCQRQGLIASFMAKPKLQNAVGNGWHIHQSVTDLEGQNLFLPDGDGLSDIASGWIAGLLAHAGASCLATTPTVNGYKRYTSHQLAPNRIGWGWDNRGVMLRALMAQGDPASRVENRVADSTANPYFALACQIHSGLDGVIRGLRAPEPLANPYDDVAERLPNSLLAAIERFQASQMYAEVLGEEVVSYFARLKRAEWERYLMTVSDWEQTEYFEAF